MTLDQFDSRRSTVYGPRGIVATSQPLAAEAGRDILRDGGNAFDAAVGTAAALNVVEPMMTGLGGDVFAMYRTANGDVGAMRAAGHAPAAATRDRVRDALAADQNSDPAAVTMPERGPHTVTVPGTARGWEATLDRFGRRTLADVLEPAIHYAKSGYPVSEVVSAQWHHTGSVFETDHARDAYLVDGAPPDVGQHVTLPALGRSLERVAEGGADVLYEGALGEAIAEEVQRAGGFLTVDDLSDFAVEWPDPLSTTYHGVEVYELGPNNQGQIALEALNIAAEVGAGEHPYDAPERVHAFLEATKLAFRDGHHYVTDPAFEPVRPLHDPEYASHRAAEIGPAALDDVPLGMPGEDADTVLLTVADDDGNLVSFINSRFMGFGSGLVAGDTGIALQNRGASFSLDPDDPNRLEPGKRPFHTLIPALARFDTDDWAAFGTMGGAMQPQGHVQVLANLIDYDMSLQAAVDAPRWRYWEDGTVALEERLAADAGAALARRGHDVRVHPGLLFGGAQIARNHHGTLSGATEPRKDGHVAAR